jgi:hypothetical protein
MRYIDISVLVLPDGWYERAEAASVSVAAGADPNDHSEVWRELKDSMAKLFPPKKCWYCESEVDRSDNAVDHFRPKNRVSEAINPHDGYRWLAFVKENYRYACTFCNSKRKDIDSEVMGGKSDRFPLQDESKRAYCCTDDINKETPLLLDPCDPLEWRLIGCKRENGKICPASKDSKEIMRVNESVEIYHLNYGATVTRRHSVAVTLLADVEEAKQLFNATQKELFKKFARKILKAINRESPYSGEMIYLLKLQRSDDHPWIQDLINA